ncbi:MocR-like pyridoxine biosynthesis transcription factor PdxR [Sinomicrobium soli]|uniref:MocR-like pyridoxine biosynthesis transcription factor PdxR n=1 Tax=Sinomicrobium sp. N-1-3-6 TaxID=2219864 RepID=UPI001374FEE5|nr:PLP-dependent aminotransferase family protein [Sinomicrobium sp. N-1-3-6]
MNTSLELLTEKLLGSFDLHTYRRDLSLYMRIGEYLKNGILRGDIPPGELLPSTRVLSQYLDVSRSTAIKAYDILLLEGLTEVRQGSGYRVRKDTSAGRIGRQKIPQHTAYPDISGKGLAFRKNVHLINSTSEEAIAFRPGLPPLDIFPVNHWKRLSNYYWRTIKASSLSYSNASGVAVLKENLARYLSTMRGLRCDPEQIIIVSGSLQSLYLTGNALIDKGDSMVMENPAFPNVHSIFRSLEARIHALPVDNEGIVIPGSGAIPPPKLIHVTPSGHYPTGVRMTPRRRKALLEWASENGSMIIENDYEHEISHWGNRDSPSLFSLDNEQRTVYLGTFNRLLHPSIRLGYMVVPYYLLDTVKALQKHSHRFVSPSNQVVMNQFIEKNYLYQHIRSLIEVAEERKALFCDIVRNEFHPSFRIVNRDVPSLHLLATFDHPVSDQELIHAFREKHLIAHAYSKCFVKDPVDGLILGYASVRKPLIHKKLSEMAVLYNALVKQAGNSG